MFIKSKIKRKNGTLVKMEGKAYHFKPNDADDHVCEVNKLEHAARFLAIKEGYERYNDPSSAKDSGTDDNEAAIAAKKLADEQREAEEIAEAKRKAAAEEGVPVTSTEGEDKPLSQVEIDKALEELESDDDNDTSDDTDDADEEPESDEWYRAQYLELMGKKPHHNTKIETIREEVNKILNPAS